MWKKLQRGLAPLEKGELEQLRKVFDRIDKNCDGVLCLNDLRATCAALKHQPDKGELEEMIWEIDETLSKTISYDEFELMYRRVRSDRTGLEPRTMFNLVDFMMNDNNGDGRIEVDEAIQLMFMRYGKEFKDEAIASLFNGQTENGNSLSYNQFLEHLEQQKDHGSRRKDLDKLRAVQSSAIRKKQREGGLAKAS